MDFVQHNHGAGDLLADGKNLADQTDELVGGDVVDDGILGSQSCAGLHEVGGEVGVSVEHRLGQDGADIQIVQLFEELLAGRFDGQFHVVEEAVFFQPNAELSLRQGLRQPLGREDDAQDDKPDALTTA